ncbi:hypothetical protein O181_020394 [Austropuccinia psidii MF-1]|uniref:Uncharacterized protein n=1 Tax=Austropuccinia psidii MF-1 TaxID=1389203 RepID=A0A9Q3CB67_9BASI|nr:hypothetical protein [Austropuccinia psidii MF-1]
MSLKAKDHINTIPNLWLIEPHGAIQQFGMLMLLHEMTSTPSADHLPFTMPTITHSLASAPPSNHLCQLPMLTLMHHCLCISAVAHPYISTPPPHHLCNVPFLGSCTTLSCSQFITLMLTK